MNDRIAATMLDVALAEAAEAERLRRGRRYARQGAVVSIVVEPGVLTGVVQGSRAEPYHVVVRVPRAGTRQAPSRRDMSFSCSCPDWESPCKHGVAVVAELVARLGSEPQLLDVWRGAGAPDAVPEPDGSGRGTSTEELDAFLGRNVDASAFELPLLAALPHVQLAWDEPWSVMLHDALRVLGRGE